MFDFADAAPVVTSRGKTAEPNPFTDVIKVIALQVDSEGKPVAKAFVLEHPEDEEQRDKAINKVYRQLASAGENNDPEVTVFRNAAPVRNPVNKVESKTKTTITFWTGPKIRKPNSGPRKPADTDTDE